MIELDGVYKTYGDTDVVSDFSLTIDSGSFCVLIGSSGSGKSTTLKMINRLIPHSRGRIAIDGRDVTSIKAETLRQRIGYAIQTIGLFPHWTVAGNIGVVPRMLGWSAQRVESRIDELLGLFKMDPAEFRAKYPHQLSGGQAQRVGVARALAADPDLLLMDEPFGALDPITRDALQEELARVHRATGKTIVFVTHDIDEAMRLGDQVALMDEGRLVQVGTPVEILTRPRNAFVRDFVGKSDLGLKLLSCEAVADRRCDAPSAAPDIGDDDRGRRLESAGHLWLLSEDGRPVRLLSRDGASTAVPEDWLTTSGMSAREALSRMVWNGVDRLPVVDEAGRLTGEVGLDALVSHAGPPAQPAAQPRRVAPA
ncbi:ABC transporter ATP-binding protein [Fodinicurvata sp. EGI_FJ10296]|uniref:ABC transporter ATP-binding protein n=1 Tax=Fodinicurvata sp. EGI_FJ10296 TaxID=3231908 RepID=UPI0034529E51